MSLTSSICIGECHHCDRAQKHISLSPERDWHAFPSSSSSSSSFYLTWEWMWQRQLTREEIIDRGCISVRHRWKSTDMTRTCKCGTTERGRKANAKCNSREEIRSKKDQAKEKLITERNGLSATATVKTDGTIVISCWSPPSSAFLSRCVSRTRARAFFSFFLSRSSFAMFSRSLSLSF